MLRKDAQLAKKKFMLRIPLARKESASDSLFLHRKFLPMNYKMLYKDAQFAEK